MHSLPAEPPATREPASLCNATRASALPEPAYTPSGGASTLYTRNVAPVRTLLVARPRARPSPLVTRSKAATPSAQLRRRRRRFHPGRMRSKVHVLQRLRSGGPARWVQRQQPEQQVRRRTRVGVFWHRRLAPQGIARRHGDLTKVRKLPCPRPPVLCGCAQQPQCAQQLVDVAVPREQRPCFNTNSVYRVLGFGVLGFRMSGF
jgi:hypothetical protein